MGKRAQRSSFPLFPKAIGSVRGRGPSGVQSNFMQYYQSITLSHLIIHCSQCELQSLRMPTGVAIGPPLGPTAGSGHKTALDLGIVTSLAFATSNGSGRTACLDPVTSCRRSPRMDSSGRRRGVSAEKVVVKTATGVRAPSRKRNSECCATRPRGITKPTARFP
jgi:hypothetical protein